MEIERKRDYIGSNVLRGEAKRTRYFTREEMDDIRKQLYREGVWEPMRSLITFPIVEAKRLIGRIKSKS